MLKVHKKLLTDKKTIQIINHKLKIFLPALFVVLPFTEFPRWPNEEAFFTSKYRSYFIYSLLYAIIYFKQ